MKVLDRYVYRTTLAGAGAALAVLLALQLVFLMIEEVDDIGKGVYTLIDAIGFVLLSLPRTLYEMLPMACLVGTLLGMGQLAATSELTAMRAVGFSVGAIARAVLRAGMLIMLAAAMVGEWVVPPAEQWAQRLKTTRQTQAATLLRDNGAWLRDGQYYVHIDEVLAGGFMKGVMVLQFDAQQRLTQAVQADAARFINSGWELAGVAVSDLREERVSFVQEPTQLATFRLEPTILDVVAVDPVRLSLRQLPAYIDYLERNGLDSARYQLAMWSKLIAPLTNLVMLLLALPFVFGSLRHSGAGQRLMIGVFLGVGYSLFSRTLNHVGLVYGIPPLVGVLLPVGVFLVGAIYGLRRVR
jgi:lipopolysaccharide export system permease protein